MVISDSLIEERERIEIIITALHHSIRGLKYLTLS